MKPRHKIVSVSLIQSNILCRLGKVTFYNWKQILKNAKKKILGRFHMSDDLEWW